MRSSASQKVILLAAGELQAKALAEASASDCRKSPAKAGLFRQSEQGINLAFIIRAVGTPNLLPITSYLLLPKNPVSNFI